MLSSNSYKINRKSKGGYNKVTITDFPSQTDAKFWYRSVFKDPTDLTFDSIRELGNIFYFNFIIFRVQNCRKAKSKHRKLVYNYHELWQ
jgi:hypothetical protein